MSRRVSLDARRDGWVLAGAGGLVVVGLSALLWSAASLLPVALVLPVALLLLAVGVVAVRHRQAEAAFVLLIVLSLAVQGSGDPGYNPFQLAFGLWLVAYCLGWYLYALIAQRRILRSGRDLAMGYWLFVAAPLAAVLGPLQGVVPADYMSDLSCALALSAYFPLRDFCVRNERGPLFLSLAIIGIGIYAVVSNLVRFYMVITGATELYEIVDVRLATGEIHISFAILFLAVGAAVSKRWRALAFVVGIFLLAGLILSKSRGAWLTTLVGLAGASYAAGFRIQRRLVVGMVGGIVALAVGSVAILGNTLLLIGAGLLRRFASLSSTGQDISLLNRQAESDATRELIFSNPILGYGWGVPVHRFDLIVKSTEVWAFIHNGYLWMWHKVGLFGLLAILVVIVASAWGGFLVARTPNPARPEYERALGAACFGSMGLLVLIVIPSNPFAVLDQMFVCTLVLALASGLRERWRPSTTDP